MAHAIEPRIRPFDMTGIERGEEGIARYVDRPASLVAMLRSTVERASDVEALVEVGAERLTYRELWERAARVAGGLRAAGVARGDRVASRLPNGVDWCLAFFGAQLAGAVIVALHGGAKEALDGGVAQGSGAAERMPRFAMLRLSFIALGL